MAPILVLSLIPAGAIGMVAALRAALMSGNAALAVRAPIGYRTNTVVRAPGACPSGDIARAGWCRSC